MLSWRDITQAASVCVVYSHYEEKARLILQNVHQKRSTDCSGVQTTVLMGEAKKPCEGNSKRSAVWDWHLFCFSLTQVIEGTSRAPGSEEATGRSDLLSQPTVITHVTAVPTFMGRHLQDPHIPHIHLLDPCLLLSPNPRASPVSNQPGSRLHSASLLCPTVF